MSWRCLAVWNSSQYKYRVVSNITSKVKDKNKKFLKARLSHWRFKNVPWLSSLQFSLNKSFICGWIPPPRRPAGSNSRLWHFLYRDPSLSVTLSSFPLLQSKESTQRAHPVCSSCQTLKKKRPVVKGEPCSNLSVRQCGSVWYKKKKIYWASWISCCRFLSLLLECTALEQCYTLYLV